MRRELDSLRLRGGYCHSTIIMEERSTWHFYLTLLRASRGTYPGSRIIIDHFTVIGSSNRMRWRRRGFGKDSGDRMDVGRERRRYVLENVK